MIEAFGVFIAVINKWFKSSRFKKHRYTGFVGTVFVAGYWSIYFGLHSMWWLTIYNILNIAIAIRGIRNNKT